MYESLVGSGRYGVRCAGSEQVQILLPGDPGGAHTKRQIPLPRKFSGFPMGM